MQQDFPQAGPVLLAGATTLVGFTLRWLGRRLLAAAITAVAVLGLILTVADAEQAAALREVFPTIGVITVIWLITGPVWELGSVRPDAADPRARDVERT